MIRIFLSVLSAFCFSQRLNSSRASGAFDPPENKEWAAISKAIDCYNSLAAQLKTDPSLARLHQTEAELQSLHQRALAIRKKIQKLAKHKDPSVFSEFRQLRDELSGLKSRRDTITQQWNTIFVLPLSSPTREFLTLASDPHLPKPLQEKIARFKITIPRCLIDESQEHPSKEVLRTLDHNLERTAELLDIGQRKASQRIDRQIVRSVYEPIKDEYERTQAYLLWFDFRDEIHFKEMIERTQSQVDRGIVLLGLERLKALESLITSFSQTAPKHVQKPLQDILKEPKKTISHARHVLNSSKESTASQLNVTLREARRRLEKRCERKNQILQERLEDWEKAFERVMKFQPRQMPALLEIQRLEKESLLESMDLLSQACELEAE